MWFNSITRLWRRTPAQAWQAAVRSAFKTAFQAGYVAVGFTRAEPQSPRYLLEHRP